MKNNRGEISIPLILTVIVLIIFGAICIFMLTGENGLFVFKSNQREQNNSVVTNKGENAATNENITNNENNVLTVPVE